jgi:hypothetical protein
MALSLYRWRAPCLAFLVAAAYVPGLPTASAMPRWWAIALGLPLCSVLNPRALSPAVRWAWVAWLAWAAVLLVLKQHPVEGALDYLFMLLLFGAAIFGAEQESLDGVLKAMIYGLACASLMVIAQACGWPPALANLVPQGAAPAGFFYNREILAEFAAPLAVWALVSRRWVLSVPVLIPVVLCHSRIAVLVLACGLIYAWVPHWRIRALLLSGVALVGLGAAIFLGIASAGLRAVLWGAAWLSITPMGHGLGWWQAAHPFPIEEFVHSDVLQAFVETGWLGGACLVAIGCIAFFSGCRCAGSECRAVRAAFLGLGIECVVSFPLHTPAAGFLLACLAGFLARNGAYLRSIRLGSGTASSAHYVGRAADAVAISR